IPQLEVTWRASSIKICEPHFYWTDCLYGSRVAHPLVSHFDWCRSRMACSWLYRGPSFLHGDGRIFGGINLNLWVQVRLNWAMNSFCILRVSTSHQLAEDLQ